MNKISSWSIRNPIPTIVLFLVLSLAGFATFPRLRENNTPDMEIPTVTVAVAQPGAAPSELENQVTRLVEDAVSGLGNVRHIRSTVNEGVSNTMIEFALGVDTDRATNDVRNAVSSIRGNLPADAQEPVVQRVDVTGMAIVTFVVDAPAMSPDEVSWFVDNDIAKVILSASGVSKIARQGGVEREVRVTLDPDRMMALGITAAEVSLQLKLVNADQRGGRATLGKSEQSIRTLGSAATIEDLAQTRLSLNDGRTVRLADLGTVESSWAEARQRARLNGQEVIGFSVFRSVGSSEVDVTHAVRAKVAEINRSHPEVTIREVTSTSTFVEAAYEAAVEAVLIGSALALLVVWLFLRDVRATIVSGAALPLSLLPTFAVMYAFNQSLNNITMLAVALVVGILVDDAIVEIENIVRHMRQSGKNAYDAAMEAADEIGLAVVATTFTIVAVFFPVAFMPGIPGQFFRAFAIAVCCAVLFSLAVARMLTPLMGAYLIKPGTPNRDQPFWIPTYLKLLRQALKYRWTTLALGVGFFVASMMLALFIPTNFISPSDRNLSILSIELPPGATLVQADGIAQRATEIIGAHPEVASVYAVIGSDASATLRGTSSAGEVRKAMVTINLISRRKRDLSQQELEAVLSKDLMVIPGARFRFGAGEGMTGSIVQVTLTSDDPAILTKSIEKLARDMRTVPGLQNVATTSSLARPEILITPKADKAAELGISTGIIAQMASIATLGDIEQNLPKFNLADRQIPIRVMLAEEARSNLERIASLQIHAGSISVPLGSVADIRLGAGPNQIDRVDRRRSATVAAELAGDFTLGEATKLIAQLPAIKDLPDNVTEVPAGDTELMQQLFGGFAMAIGSGIVLMYTVLVLLFRGFLQPVTILAALPLSVGGALSLLLITGNAMSVSALIGILMLMGIAAKNSILLVEYAIVAERERGLDRVAALMDAGRKRARPIVMTTVAMCCGMSPVALGLGADSEFRMPMAIAVIGGLISSTALSLLFVPAVYTVMDGLQRRLGNLLGKLIVKSERPVPAIVSIDRLSEIRLAKDAHETEDQVVLRRTV